MSSAHRIDPSDSGLRRIVAAALAEEHRMPLGFHDEEDQRDFDLKAQRVLAALAEASRVPS